MGGEDLFIAILESLNHFDKEYCFELELSMPKKIKNFIKLKILLWLQSNIIISQPSHWPSE